jgi:hypothetical protein
LNAREKGREKYPVLSVVAVFDRRNFGVNFTGPPNGDLVTSDPLVVVGFGEALVFSFKALALLNDDAAVGRHNRLMPAEVLPLDT